MTDYTTYKLRGLIKEFHLLNGGTQLATDIGIGNDTTLIKENRRRMDAIKNVVAQLNESDQEKFKGKTNKTYLLDELLPKHMKPDTIKIPPFDLKEPTEKHLKDVLSAVTISYYENANQWANSHFGIDRSEHPYIANIRKNLRNDYYRELGEYKKRLDDYNKRYGPMRQKKDRMEKALSSFLHASLENKPQYLPKNSFLRSIIEYEIAIKKELEKKELEKKELEKKELEKKELEKKELEKKELEKKELEQTAKNKQQRFKLSLSDYTMNPNKAPHIISDCRVTESESDMLNR